MVRFNQAVLAVAEKVRGTCVFIRIPSTEHTLIQFFGIPPDRLPQVFLYPYTGVYLNCTELNETFIQYLLHPNLTLILFPLPIASDPPPLPPSTPDALALLRSLSHSHTFVLVCLLASLFACLFFSSDHGSGHDTPLRHASVHVFRFRRR